LTIKVNLRNIVNNLISLTPSLLQLELNRRFNGVRAHRKWGRSWVEPRSGQTKEYEIGICCFSARHAAL